MDNGRVHPRTLAGDSFAAERKRAELVEAIVQDEAQQGRSMTSREREAFARGFFGLGRLELLALLKAPHGCMNGRVFIGHMVEDEETGEEAEVIEAVPCRRCASERSAEASRGGNQ